MSDDFRDLKFRRLPNWGRWAWSNPDAPDSSCANPLYAMMVRSDDDDYGYGDIVSATVRRLELAPGAHVAAEIDEIDEIDAQSVEALILQTPRDHRRKLVARYVLWHNVDPLPLDAAIRAITDLIAANLNARLDTLRALRLRSAR